MWWSLTTQPFSWLKFPKHRDTVTKVNSQTLAQSSLVPSPPIDHLMLKQCLLWTAHAWHRSPITHNTSQVHIRESITLNDFPSGDFIITHMGSEVPQTHYELPKMSFLEHHKHISEVAGLCICSTIVRTFPPCSLKPRRGNSLVSKQKLQPWGAQLGLVSIFTPTSCRSPWVTLE